jgi:hypothetical protein
MRPFSAPAFQGFRNCFAWPPVCASMFADLALEQSTGDGAFETGRAKSGRHFE